MHKTMNIIQEIKEAWGWIGIEPIEVVNENDFGNLLIKDTNGQFWRLCPEDEYCENHNINYKKCGKLVIANAIEEKEMLQSILNQARNNGVKDGRIIFKDEIQELEPNITAIEAIHFPSSGKKMGYIEMEQLYYKNIKQPTWEITL